MPAAVRAKCEYFPVVMWTHLSLAILSALGAVALFPRHGTALFVTGCGLFAAWQLWSAVTRARAPQSRVILRLGGFAWTVEDFCRGWLITGETGSGKTLGGINTMLWQVSQNAPHWAPCLDAARV